MRQLLRRNTPNTKGGHPGADVLGCLLRVQWRNGLHARYSLPNPGRLRGVELIRQTWQPGKQDGDLWRTGRVTVEESRKISEGEGTKVVGIIDCKHDSPAICCCTS